MITKDSLLCSLAAAPMERLRWYVLDYFKLPPWAELSESDILWAAANMALDKRERTAGERADINGAFDESAFAARKEGR